MIKRFSFLAVAFIVSLILSACSGQGSEASSSISEESVESSVIQVSQPESSFSTSGDSEASSEPDAPSKEEVTSSEESSTTSESIAEQASDPGVGTIYKNINAIYSFDHITDSRVGTQEELDDIKALLSSLTSENVALLATDSMPNDYTSDRPLSADETTQLIGLINQLKPALLPEEELGNPYTGGGWTAYIETSAEKICISYSGWFTVSYPSSDTTLVFEAESNRDAFGAVSSFIWEKMNTL